MDIKTANLNYSCKNVPIPTKKQYLRMTITKAEDLIQRMRWKAYYYNKQHVGKIETFNFRTLKNAPQCNDLMNFENDLNNLIANLEYKEYKTPFQKRLANDIRKINKSTNIFCEGK